MIRKPPAVPKSYSESPACAFMFAFALYMYWRIFLAPLRTDTDEFVQTTEKESRTEILMGLPVQTFELISVSFNFCLQ
jgi:hypothetical protein